MRLIFLLFTSFILNAQTTYKKGIVLQSTDSLPLTYVNIYSKSHKFGTITNELGAYILNYKDSLYKTQITFSAIGYETKKIPLNAIRDTIYLKPSNIELDQIIIHNTNTDISYVLDKVKDNIKHNYSNKRHLLKAFYRQTAYNQVDSNYLRIVEADIGIQEYGILKALDRDRIKIYNYRKSDDNITKKWYHTVAEKAYGGHPNFLTRLKQDDFIKNFLKHKSHKFYHKNILNSFNFELESLQNINDDIIGIYSFIPNKFQNITIADEDKNKLYINLNDYAIVKIKYNFHFKNSKTGYRIISPPSEFNYTKFGSTYYLSSASQTKFYSQTSNKKEFITDRIVTYQIIEDRKLYPKIKRKEKEGKIGDIYKKEKNLDSVFWANYKILPLVPLEAQRKRIIEQNKSLTQQFKDNGEN